MSTYKAVGVLLLAILSVQGGATIAKQLFQLIGPEGATSLRLGFGAMILTIALRPWKLKFNKVHSKDLICYGIALGTMNFLFYHAIKEIPIGLAVAIEFTGPLSVALFFSRRPIDFVWIAIVVIGLALLLPIGREVHNLNLKGILYALGAGVFWAIYIVFGRRAGREFGTASVAIGMLIGAIMFVPVGFIIEGAQLLSPKVLAIGFLVALFSSAIPFALEMISMTALPEKTYGTLSSLEPAVGALFGLVFLQEYLTLIQWLALSLIMGASLGAVLTARRANKKAS